MTLVLFMIFSCISVSLAFVLVCSDSIFPMTHTCWHDMTELCSLRLHNMTKLKTLHVLPINNNVAKTELTNNLQIAKIHIGFIDNCRCITAIISTIRQRNIFHWDLITTRNISWVFYSYCAACYVFPWNISGITCNGCRITLLHKLNTRSAISWP